jgi:hypothetical protein
MELAFNLDMGFRRLGKWASCRAPGNICHMQHLVWNSQLLVFLPADQMAKEERG